MSPQFFLIMLAQMSYYASLCLYAFSTYYAQNYASIIRKTLTTRPHFHLYDRVRVELGVWSGDETTIGWRTPEESEDQVDPPAVPHSICSSPKNRTIPSKQTTQGSYFETPPSWLMLLKALDQEVVSSCYHQARMT